MDTLAGLELHELLLGVRNRVSRAIDAQDQLDNLLEAMAVGGLAELARCVEHAGGSLRVQRARDTGTKLVWSVPLP